jgi:hypothetical protein
MIAARPARFVRAPLHGKARRGDVAWRRLHNFWFGQTDLRPLGLFRILLGLQLFNWFWQLYPFLTTFFTDDGLVPADNLGVLRPNDFTFLAFASQPWQVGAVWLIGLVAAVLLTVGYRTRMASVVSFVTVALFNGRDPLILDGSDVVLRIVPLWLAFTAAGACFSVDAALLRRRRGLVPSRRGFALPVRVLELQVAWIYLASGIEKLGGSTWLNGTATSWVFQLTNTYARPWAAPLATNSELVHLTSWGTLAIELAFLPLVFLPVWFRIARWIAIVAAASLHVGILAFMNVGNFPVTMLSLLVLLLPLRNVPEELPLVRRSGLSLEVTVILCVLACSSFLTAMPFVPGSASTLLARVGLTQRWDMFAPNPSRSDSSLLVLGHLEDGSSVPLLPAEADPLYSRWRKVAERAQTIADPELGAMFCRAMRSMTPAHLALLGLDIVAIERTTRPAGTEPIVSQRTRWSGPCA